jgi:hypothetical protein
MREPVFGMIARPLSRRRTRINDFTVPYFSGAFEETDPFAEHPERAIIP